MANILSVGIATLDIINTVESYPSEDSEIRVLSQRKTRGGNATNSLVVLSQLGHHCHWAGVLINEPDTQIVDDDLAYYGISSNYCQRLDTGKIPTSYITLSNQTGSRSILHYRDCPEYRFADFKNIDLTQFDWLHFEGRNIGETRLMLEYVTQYYPALPCSLEVEKARPDIDSLFHLPKLLFFSKNYAQAIGINQPDLLLKRLAQSQAVTATCTWGDEGAWAITPDQQIIHSPAGKVSHVVDTIGAGDTFNAAMISCLLNGKTLQNALNSACQLASKKCQQQGFTHLIEHPQLP